MSYIFHKRQIWTAGSSLLHIECLETLLPRKDVILMSVYVSVQSKYMPPCQWYLHNNASYPYRLQWCTSIPGQMFALAPVAGESLVGPFRLWDWELDVHFFPKTSWNVDSSDPSTHSHCLLDHLRWAQAQRTRRYLHGRSTFIPKHDTLNYCQFTCSLWTVSKELDNLIWIIFSLLFCLCPNFFGVCCSHQNPNLFIFTKYNYVGQWKLLSVKKNVK
jgi:hypothetical protein